MVSIFQWPFFFFRVCLPFLWRLLRHMGLNQSCSHRPMPEPQQHRIQAESATYAPAHGNTGSLTRWARPGIEPATLWFLVGFINHCATKGPPVYLFLVRTFILLANFNYAIRYYQLQSPWFTLDSQSLCHHLGQVCIFLPTSPFFNPSATFQFYFWVWHFLDSISKW